MEGAMVVTFRDGEEKTARRVMILVLVCTAMLLFAGEVIPAGAVTGAGWIKVNDAAFDVRESPTALIFDDGCQLGEQMWVIGGLKDFSVLFSDVWNSTDGITWTRANPGGTFESRYGHTSVAFDDNMWVIGGNGEFSWSLNDVWNSPDGINWAPVTAAAGFSPRYGHSSVVFDDNSGLGNQMWVIGGIFDNGADPTVKNNDVWSSTDGITWTQATSSAGFSPRYGHASVVFENKMWVIGGVDESSEKNDTWYSTDGINWIEATSSAGFPPRTGHTSVVFDGRLWVIGGSGEGNYYRDVWSSADGISWSRATSTALFPGRFGHASLVFGPSMWIIGGNSEGTDLSDVWINSSYDEPAVGGILPASGITGESIPGTLSGTGFLAGATVKLSKEGAEITADNVIINSPEELTCDFELSGADVGPYDVVVTNVDGQWAIIEKGFTILYDYSPVLDAINPTRGSNIDILDVSLTGSGFSDVVMVSLTNSTPGDIPAYDIEVIHGSPDMINCTFDLIDQALGTYNINVTNADGQSAWIPGGFQIRLPPPSVDSISPQYGDPEGEIRLSINGMYFVDGAKVDLIQNYETHINGTDVQFISPTLLTAKFYVKGAKNATWDIEVINPDGQSSLASKYNNLFQFVVYAAKSVASPPSGGSGYTSNSRPAAPNVPPPESPPAAPTSIEADVHITSQGVITQETVLQSGDSAATLTIPPGTVAEDASGNPLASVSIAPLSPTAVPAETPGGLFSFAGQAYNLGPDGATFSPAITLSFTVPPDQEGVEYTIQTFDSATNTWVDIPTVYDPETGTVTAQVSHFCYFALYARTPLTATATTAAPPQTPVVPKPAPTPQRTAMTIFSGLVLWIGNLVIMNPFIIAAIVIVVAAIFLLGGKRRRKRLLDRFTGKP